MTFINALKKYWLVNALVALLLICIAITSITYLQYSRIIQINTQFLEQQTITITGNNVVISFKDLDEYLKADQQLRDLKINAIAIQTRSSVNFLFGTRVDSILAHTTNVIEVYEQHVEGVQTVKENVIEDFKLTNQIHASVPSIFRNATNNLTVNTALSSIRKRMNPLQQEKVNIKQAVRKFNQEIGNTAVDAPYDSVQIKVYNSFINELEFQEAQINELYSALQQAEKFELNQQKAMDEIATNFNSQTGNINIVYEQFQPLTQNLSRQIQPVRNGIQTLERNVLPGISALSLLSRVDPVSARSITFIRDISNQIIRMENEINSLIQNIMPMREASARYSSSKTRENATRLQNQAKITAAYLEEKRGVFDPVYENIEEANSHVQRLNQAIYNVNNSNARNMLLDFTRGASQMLNQVGVPIENYKSTVNSTITSLRQIENFEKEYSTTIENIASIKPKIYERPTVSQKGITGYINMALSHRYFVIIFIVGGIVIIGLITFIALHKKDNETTEKRKVLAVKEEEQMTSEEIKKTESKKKPIHFNLKKPDSENKYENKLKVVDTKEPSDKSESSDTLETSDNTKDTIESEIEIAVVRAQDDFKSFLNQEGDKTIIVQEAFREAIPIPGYLFVINGVQANKKLKLYGCNTRDGIKATIGRDAPNWKRNVKSIRQKTHIRIADSSRSLSRLQAEIIFKSGNLYIRNLSKSNPTIVNGFSLFGKEKIRLNSGSVITAGYLKVKFIR